MTTFLKKHSEKGQILLAMILTMVVVLTIGLSVASRSITNLRISRQNEESSRAFQAAEAGIQQVLQEQVSGRTGDIELPGDLGNNALFDADLRPLSGGQILVDGNATIPQDVGASVKLSSGVYTIQIRFGETTQNDCSASNPRLIPPALEVLVLENQANPTMKKYLFDPCRASRMTSATVDASISNPPPIGSQNYQFATTAGVISLNNPFVMRVIPLFNSTKIGVVSNGPALPEQGKLIESTGRSGDTIRKLQYFESDPEIPVELFQYAILSQ